MNLYDEFAHIEPTDIKNDLPLGSFTEMKDSSRMVSPVAMSPESTTTVSAESEGCILYSCF